MGTVSLILGESGTGKTASLRHLNPETCLLIQSIQKPLPFPAKAWRPWAAKDPHSSIYVSDLWQPVKMALSRAYSYGKRIAVVDDFQYIMANEFMRRGEEKSYDKFTEIAHHTWDILHHTIHHTPPDLRVYFLSHSEDTASGKIKMKTVGKLLDEKITLEGMFTTVLRTCVKDGRYLLSTQNNGFDTVKSPMGLFDSAEIDNDFSFVDAALCDYYQLTPSHPFPTHHRSHCMTLNPFIYNPQQALAAGQSGFITDSGSYVVTITDARFRVQPSGAKSIELSIETEEGRKAQYLHLYHEKKDGTANPYGLHLIHALMGCMGVRQLHPPTHPGGPVSEFIGKKVGLMLQKTLKTRADGKETYRLDIILPFFAQTRQTLREKLDGQTARDVDNRLASLKDKDERTLLPLHTPSFNDAIPF